MAHKGTGRGYQFLREHMADEDGPCLIWPLTRDNHGYGQGGHNGRLYKAHRLMCELVYGPCPSPAHQASHSCGNGHKGCVHPKHLSWETRRDNHLRRRANGTAATSIWGHKGKITVEVAAAILALEGKATQQEIAERFNCSKPTVRRIFKRKTRAARGETTPLDWRAINLKGAETKRQKRAATS